MTALLRCNSAVDNQLGAGHVGGLVGGQEKDASRDVVGVAVCARGNRLEQRGAVVRALINEPQLLLADEPTGALDEDTADKLGQLLVELNREENVTLITVTHSPSLADRMDRTVKLSDGQIIS